MVGAEGDLCVKLDSAIASTMQIIRSTKLLPAAVKTAIPNITTRDYSCSGNSQSNREAANATTSTTFSRQLGLVPRPGFWTLLHIVLCQLCQALEAAAVVCIRHRQSWRISVLRNTCACRSPLFLSTTYVRTRALKYICTKTQHGVLLFSSKLGFWQWFTSRLGVALPVNLLLALLVAFACFDYRCGSGKRLNEVLELHYLCGFAAYQSPSC